MEAMTTGELANGAGVNVQTVRYYERRGLLPEPPRTSSGYRQYGPDDLRRLLFIRRAQELGFQLAEIKELLSLRVREDGSCGEVQERAEGAISRIEEQLRQLTRMRSALASLAEACERQEPTAECPILEALEGDHDRNRDPRD